MSYDYMGYDRYDRHGGGGRGASTSSLVGVAVLLTVVVAGILIFAIAGDYYPTNLWWVIRESLFWIITGVVVLLVVVVAAAVHPGLGLAVGIVGVAAWIFYVGPVHEYQQASAYDRSVEVSTDDASTPKVNEGDVPELGQRAPYTVAQAQAQPNLGSYPGDIVGTTYVPDGDRYATLVTRRGSFAGYHVVMEQSIPLTGRGSAARYCEFDPRADDKLGGYLGHNLGRAIAHERKWWSFSDSDAYSVCVDGVPKVFVPLKRQTGGVFTVTQRFAGVAVYDGKTGAVEIVTDPKRISEMPGPAYPLTLAATQRTSTHAMHGFSDFLWGRAGWETTDENDGTDVNSGNTSEFVLPLDGKTAYVTPLTGRGSATAISAVSILRPSADGLAMLRVYRVNPPWLSTGALDSRIRGDFQDLPNWQNIRVMEVLPRDGHRFVATLGNDQNVLYRVEGPGNPVVGSNELCLYNSAGVKVRCGPVVNQNGAGPGVSIENAQPGTVGSAGSVAVPDDISKLSDEEFARLLDRVAQEAGRRLAAETARTTAPAAPGGR